MILTNQNTNLDYWKSLGAKRSLLVPIHLALLGLAATLIAAPPPAAAQELVTDRPDQTESAVTVPAGRWQIETGWSFTSDEEGGLRVELHEAPSTLARLGLSERWELRLGWGGLARLETRAGGVSETFDGALDAELGAKVVLRGAEGGGPQAALLFATSLPVGADRFTSDRFDPSFRLSIAHELGDWSLGYNLGAAWSTEEDAFGEEHTLSRALYTVALGRGLSDRLGFFVEAFGEVAGSAGGPPAHSLDGGLTWLVDPRLQLDLAVGVGLSDAADDYFVGLGLSVRVPR